MGVVEIKPPSWRSRLFRLHFPAARSKSAALKPRLTPLGLEVSTRPARSSHILVAESAQPRTLRCNSPSLPGVFGKRIRLFDCQRADRRHKGDRRHLFVSLPRIPESGRSSTAWFGKIPGGVHAAIGGGPMPGASEPRPLRKRTKGHHRFVTGAAGESGHHASTLRGPFARWTELAPNAT